MIARVYRPKTCMLIKKIEQLVNVLDNPDGNEPGDHGLVFTLGEIAHLILLGYLSLDGE